MSEGFTYDYEPPQSILLRPEEFVEDASSQLGRANGNTYQRKPGVDNVHDGQMMIRLKKKRFIILDYGFAPNAHDFELSKNVPHVTIPNGAGTQKCSSKGCQRIGVPVLLYDSEPNEPMSLYMRGGMCFSCQRNLNEKRRTQRKRKQPSGEAGGDVPSLPLPGPGPGPGSFSRFRYNDHIVDLNSDAVVINGAVDGTRTHGPDYRCPEIGSDLLRIVSDLSQETLSLLQNSSSGAPTADYVNQLYSNAFLSASRATFLLTQWKASFDAQQQVADEAVASANFDSRILDEAAGNTLQSQNGMAGFEPSLSLEPFNGGGMKGKADDSLNAEV